MNQPRSQTQVVMGPFLESLLSHVQQTLPADDVPPDRVFTFTYVQRAIMALLDASPIGDYYDPDVIALLEPFVERLLRHYTLSHDEVTLIPVPPSGLPYLVLEIHDGCLK